MYDRQLLARLSGSRSPYGMQHGSERRLLGRLLGLATMNSQHCSSAWDAQAVRQRSSTAHSTARLDSAARPHGMSAKFGGTARPHRLSARVVLSFMVVDLGSLAPQHTAQQLSLAAQAGSTLGRAAPPPCERFTCLPAFEPHGRARRTLTQTCRPSGSRRGGGTTHRSPPAPPPPHSPPTPPNRTVRSQPARSPLPVLRAGADSGGLQTRNAAVRAAGAR